MRRIKVPYTRPMGGDITYASVIYISNDKEHVVNVSSVDPIDYDEILRYYRPVKRVYSVDYVKIGKDIIEIGRN